MDCPVKLSRYPCASSRRPHSVAIDHLAFLLPCYGRRRSLNVSTQTSSWELLFMQVMKESMQAQQLVSQAASHRRK